jgi:8-oxo-dGTP pyrophosphatase MutT (NUDIX family)
MSSPVGVSERLVMDYPVTVTFAAPSRMQKGASDPADPNPVDAEHVLSLMRQNFPESALGWVKDTKWIGPVQVAQDRIDVDDEKSWAAEHQPKRVKHFVKAIRTADTPHPAVMVQEPGENNIKVIDGRHRALAYRKLNQPVPAYVGFVDANGGPWDEMHLHQYHQGEDPANKAAKTLAAAGLAVRARDTGRVLMLQRALAGHDDKPDPAGGYLEFPGGRLDDGESPKDAARREWAEETGCKVPDGKITGKWTAGVYRGFVLSVPSEDDVPIHDGRDEVTNPDDPDGDQVESIIWLDPAHLDDNPTIRPELAKDLARVHEALATAPVDKINKCLTCGCDMPHNEHDDPRHITYEELAAAAEAAGITVEEAAANLQHTLHHEQRLNKGHPYPGQRYHHGWIPVTGIPSQLHDDEAAIHATFNYHDEKTGLSAEVTSIRGGGRSTYIDIEIKDRNGNVVGSATRTIRPADQLTVQHDGMAIEPNVQGHGFATRYNAHTEQIYRNFGIHYVTTEAGLNVGGYSNARMGFDFANDFSRREVARRFESAAPSLPASLRTEIDRLVSDPHTTPIEFAMLGYTPGATTWPGKELMLGSTWSGLKTLHDPGQETSS